MDWKWIFDIICFLFLCFLTSNNSSTNYKSSKSLYKLEKLSSLRDDTVSLSGFSAGASMAIQTHISHSAIFSGLAIFGQVFYRCGPHSLIQFGLRCSRLHISMKEPILPFPLAKSLADARLYESLGIIDQLSNLNNQKIFIWSGSDDEYIPSSFVSLQEDFYKNLTTGNCSNTKENIKLTIWPKARHLLPTDNFGGACWEDAAENFYLGNCNYSGAFESLKFILGSANIQKPSIVDGVGVGFELSELREYNQSEFGVKGGGVRSAWMGQTGFIYIPKYCEGDGSPPATRAESQTNTTNVTSSSSYNKSRCHLHINFHGCNEWSPEVAEGYIRNSGFLEVAEKNNIVLLFPLTTKLPGNMGGCWDFYSYSGKLFGSKLGRQVGVVERMLKRILHGTK